MFVRAGVEFAFRVGTKFQTTRLVQWPVTELCDILYCFLVYAPLFGICSSLVLHKIASDYHINYTRPQDFFQYALNCFLLVSLYLLINALTLSNIELTKRNFYNTFSLPKTKSQERENGCIQKLGNEIQ